MSTSARGWSFARLVCRLRGHSWGQGYREPDGYPLCVCQRCGLTEQWAGGMLMSSSNWRESERLNRKDEAEMAECGCLPGESCAKCVGGSSAWA